MKPKDDDSESEEEEDELETKMNTDVPNEPPSDPDDVVPFAMGINQGFHVIGSNTIDFRPIAMSTDVVLKLDNAAIWDLYNRKLTGFTYHDNSTNLTSAVSSWDGQNWGALVFAVNENNVETLTVKLTIKMVAEVFAMTTFTSGQFYPT